MKLSRAELSNKHTAIYRWLLVHRRELLDSLFPRNNRSKITLECCLSDARKYKTRYAWSISSHSLYSAAQKNGWLQECCQHMKGKKITIHECKEDARNYSTRTSWMKTSKRMYTAAYRNGWLDACCDHMDSPFVWTLEACKRSASKYQARKQWDKHASGAYQAARKNIWMEECCSHMKKRSNTKD